MSARDDARAQGKQTSPFQPYLPACETPYPPEGVEPSLLVWAETVAPGAYTHKVVARGTRIRLEDVDGEACAHVLLFNADQPWERYNAADTVKIPWQAYPSEGHPLLSGDGRVLATIAKDTSGHHDAFCGAMTDRMADEKWGEHRSHTIFPSGQSLFEQAAAKHNLTRRDLPPSISFFKGVHVEEDGLTSFTGANGAGTTVDLVAELPLIILIANAPHPLDPRADYICGPLRVHAWKSEPTSEEGPTSKWFKATPERHRAYLNSIDYAEARGL